MQCQVIGCTNTDTKRRAVEVEHVGTLLVVLCNACSIKKFEADK